MAPGGDEDLTPRGAHPRELVDELALVRHVLAALHGPHQVEGVRVERLVQSVGDLKRGSTSQTLFLGELVRPCGLDRGERDALRAAVTPAPGHVPGRPADAAADVEDPLRIRRFVQAGPFE